MTWPVALGAADHIAIDLGDPAFVSFVISWGSQHWIELLSGDLTAATRFWSAPIFYPEPLTTAYSEHFALHSLLTLPVYAVTRNAILCYNLWFLASFALAGFSMFLLALRLAPTDSARSGQARLPLGAFVAGLAFALAPYRFASLSHLQVLSSFWMPLVLLGLHQFFESGKKRALVLASAALWAQCLASGYYLVFFPPFAVLFALIELTVRKRLADVRTWMALGIAAAVTLTAVLPFVWPYLEVQRVLNLKRPLDRNRVVFRRSRRVGHGQPGTSRLGLAATLQQGMVVSRSRDCRDGDVGRRDRGSPPSIHGSGTPRACRNRPVVWCDHHGYHRVDHAWSRASAAWARSLASRHSFAPSTTTFQASTRRASRSAWPW